LMFMFTCPCLQRRNSMVLDEAEKRYTCLLWWSGELVGVFCFLLGVGIMYLGVGSARRADRGFLSPWLFSWGISYVACVGFDCALKYNPTRICLWVRDNQCLGCLCCGLLAFMEVGQWQVERRIVVLTLRHRHAQAKYEAMQRSLGDTGSADTEGGTGAGTGGGVRSSADATSPAPTITSTTGVPTTSITMIARTTGAGASGVHGLLRNNRGAYVSGDEEFGEWVA
jgi:hypothetical protein